jgi:threonine aldolase
VAVHPVETNIVIFAVDDAPGLVAALEREGVLMGAVGAGRVRAVTHLDVSAADVDLALDAVRATVVRATT